jgi:hypothetical protein
MPKEESVAPKGEVKTVAAKPLSKRFAKVEISHGHNVRPEKDANGVVRMVCDTLKIEAGAELPDHYDPVKEGLEEGVHWEYGR